MVAHLLAKEGVASSNLVFRSETFDTRSLGTAVRALGVIEPRFAQIVERHGRPPLWPRDPGFGTLVLLLLEQQVSLAQARAMHARVVAAAGAITPDAIVGLGEPGLRSIGVTRQKSAYLFRIAERVRSGVIDLDALAGLPDAAVAHALEAEHGIGPWTAQCYLLFALRRRDAFPTADLALLETVRGLWRLRDRPTPAALAERANAWRPRRAAAARLLWHHYLSERRRG